MVCLTALAMSASLILDQEHRRSWYLYAFMLPFAAVMSTIRPTLPFGQPYCLSTSSQIANDQGGHP
jgi:hypothetical protein